MILLLHAPSYKNVSTRIHTYHPAIFHDVFCLLVCTNTGVTLRTSVVVPGFIETHTHVVLQADNFPYLDVNSKKCPNVKAVCEEVRKEAERLQSEKNGDQKVLRRSCGRKKTMVEMHIRL